MKEEARNREEAGRKPEGKTFWLARDIKKGTTTEYPTERGESICQQKSKY